MTFTPRTKKLLILLACVSAFASVWHLAIAPKVFPTVACVIQEPNGELVKAWGDDCNSDRAVAVLKTQD